MNTAPIDVPVTCTDGPAGMTTALILNPVTKALTHFVVLDPDGPTTIERLVPVGLVASSAADNIRLNCTVDEFKQLEVFSETYFYPNDFGTSEYYEPYITPIDVSYISQEEDHIPPGELAIRRGANVEATDGFVGNVQEFIVNPQNSQITHLVLERGHFWGRRELTLPVNTVDRLEANTVYLKLSKEDLATLPLIPVNRKGHEAQDLEIIIWLFEEQGLARTALETLQNTTGIDKNLILNSATVSKNKEGRTTLKETDDMDTGHGALFGALTGGIIGLIAGPIGAIVGAAAGAATGGAAAHWIDMGLDDTNLKALRDSLQPGKSALILVVEEESIQPILETLGHMGGKRVQQSLSRKALRKLADDGKDA